MSTITKGVVAQLWKTLKANADAYAGLHASSRALWRPIAVDMAVLRAEYPADQAFSAALEEHGIEFSKDDRAAFIWLGENLTTDQQWTEALATNPRTSVRTFVDAIRPRTRNLRNQSCETATQPKSVSQAAKPAEAEVDVPEPLRKLAEEAEAKFTEEEIKALKRTLQADFRKAVKERLDAEFEARVEARIQAILKERLAEEWKRYDMAEQKLRERAEVIREITKGVPLHVTQEEFRVLRSVLGEPERESTPEQRTKAAQIWNSKTAHIDWKKVSEYGWLSLADYQRHE
jgi:hypothetical protein